MHGTKKKNLLGSFEVNEKKKSKKKRVLTGR